MRKEAFGAFLVGKLPEVRPRLLAAMFPACERSPASRVRLTDQWRKADIRNGKSLTLLEPLVLAVSKGTV